MQRKCAIYVGIIAQRIPQNLYAWLHAKSKFKSSKIKLLTFLVLWIKLTNAIIIHQLNKFRFCQTTRRGRFVVVHLQYWWQILFALLKVRDRLVRPLLIAVDLEKVISSDRESFAMEHLAGDANFNLFANVSMVFRDLKKIVIYWQNVTHAYKI